VFLKPFDVLIVRAIKNQRWKLIAPLDYEAKKGFKVRVRQGFVTDLASIPKALRVFYTVNGEHRKAAVLHDYCYYKLGSVAPYIKLNRKEVDELFLEAMKGLGVGWFKRYSMYFAVRVGGWASWGK